jgi:hypothetical protein
MNTQKVTTKPTLKIVGPACSQTGIIFFHWIYPSLFSIIAWLIWELLPLKTPNHGEWQSVAWQHPLPPIILKHDFSYCRI